MEKKVGYTDFTEAEKNLISVICSMYNIQALTNKDGVFKGLVPKGTWVILNGTFLSQLINSRHIVYVEGKFNGVMQLTILAQ